MQKQPTPWYIWFILAGGVWLVLGRPGVDSLKLLPISSKVTRATYVYDAQTSAIPAGVSAGLQKLNTAGIVATAFERDDVDGTGEIPEQYKIAKAAAKEIPALVVQAGEKVLRVVKSPKTEAETLEAAK